VKKHACGLALNELQESMQAVHQEKAMNPQSFLPPDTYHEVCSLHANVIEVLRHFYSSSPGSQRMERLIKCLHDLRAKIATCSESDLGAEANHLLAPLNAAISRALSSKSG
jgi:hypothetical protein